MSNVQSVERAFAVLRCLAAGSAGVSDVAERAHLPKSTVSRLLATLGEVGAVEQLADGTYRVGDAMADIAAGATPGRHLVAVARPSLTELVATLGEDAGLSVLDGSDVYYLDQVRADASVGLRDWTGERVPAHCVSSGLVLLAHLSPGIREAAIPRPLVRLTSRTVVSRAALRARLAAVAAQPAAWVFGEYDDDINSVAAPVRDATGAVVAAVHVHGPAYRFPGTADPEAIASRVVAAARRRRRPARPRRRAARGGVMSRGRAVHRRAARRRHVGRDVRHPSTRPRGRCSPRCSRRRRDRRRPRRGVGAAPGSPCGGR